MCNGSVTEKGRVRSARLFPPHPQNLRLLLSVHIGQIFELGTLSIRLHGFYAERPPQCLSNKLAHGRSGPSSGWQLAGGGVRGGVGNLPDNTKAGTDRTID